MDDATAILDGLADPLLYERDFYAWTQRQAALLKTGQTNELDLANLAEEIESMGKSLRRELTSRIAIILIHLLKWRSQPGLRSSSWEGSIRIQRIEVADHLAENPSLRAHVQDAMDAAYRRAIVGAEGETGLPKSAFPQTSPWTFEQIMDEAFWPEG